MKTAKAEEKRKEERLILFKQRNKLNFAILRWNLINFHVHARTNATQKKNTNQTQIHFLNQLERSKNFKIDPSLSLS